MNQYNEDNLIEKPSIKIFESLGYNFINAYQERYGNEVEINEYSPCLGREDRGQVVLISKLKEALKRINPGINNEEVINKAIEELTKDRSSMSLVTANKEIYNLIKDGINVNFINDEGVNSVERVKIIDFDNYSNNDFFLTSQFWVSGDIYKRRADLVGFVNGLPLIFVELKAVHKNLKDAFANNIRDYKTTIPKMFWYNTFIIISNGIESKIGSITSEFEHFNEWKKINNEGEKGIVSLDTIIQGTCEKEKFLDILENFVLFDSDKKIIAKNHQYLGVNNSINKLKETKESKEERGKIGVFWHTQGSGKSYSMVFFSQKVLRKFVGNYTFVVVTDRKELDKQICNNFANVGIIQPGEKAHAETIEDLRDLLKKDHRFVFTLIHKFQLQNEETKFPILSERSDIIVMTDEAHRSQYDLMALNMRNALPNANFIGFTGTPLIEGEEQKTKETFGDYVSVYNFRQSVEDGATVPLYYENRIPSLQINAEEFNEKMEGLLEEIEIDEDQEKKLNREFGREYNVITGEDRLETIAEDCIEHFNNRGNDGKALFVTIDRLTAVKMYDKMKKQPNCPDIAVVVSSSQNEAEYFNQHGVDIMPHRIRIAKEDLEKKFKDPSDPLKIVIVCNMWLTGFDVQCLSTLYLDKPMKNHTLMQTIARANRVYTGKTNGLIVDYIGVFRNLQKALAVYATSINGDVVIKSKDQLIEELEEAILLVNNFCLEQNIDLTILKDFSEFKKIDAVDTVVNTILVREEIKNKFLSLADKAIKYFGAILPDKRANKYFENIKLFRVLTDRIRILTKKEVDISEISDKIEKILDESIESDGYNIKDNSKITDLSKIDFDKLKERFEKSNKHIETEKLKAEIEKKLEQMIKLNSSRKQLLERLQKLIEDYNLGAKNIEEFFEDLVILANDIGKEEKRSFEQDLTEEELAIVDLAVKPDLSQQEIKKIKTFAKIILEKLKDNQLVLDWRKIQQSRSRVRVTIREAVLSYFPDEYTEEEKDKYFNSIYQHVYDNYFGEGKSTYSTIN